jgi:GH35 family endo-1,4-beta-xylanase
MKHTKKILGTMLLAALVTTSCVDDDKLEYAFEKPASIAGYEYLADYDALKTYVNRTASPNFKLGGALAANDYNADGLITRLANSNFDEIVAGNAMKMASCVGEKGEMDFGTVETFVSKATENGLNVYGHTLAWHAQQPKKWLERLLKDRELDIDPDALVETLVTAKDYTSTPDGPFPHYPMGCEPPIVNGAIHFVPTGDWSQFFIFPGGENSLTEGNYLCRLYMASNMSTAGVQLTVQNGWGGDAQNISVNIAVEEGDQVYELQFPGITGGNYDCILKPQTAGATLDVKKIEFYKLESPAVEVEQEVNVQTYTDGPFPFYPMGCEPPVINGAIHFEPNGGWSQFFCFPGGDNKLDEGDYVVYLDLQSNKDAGGIQFTMQNGWGGDAQNMTVGVPVKAGRQNYRLQFPGVEGGNYDCILKPQTADATLDLYSVTVCKVVKMNSIPLTPEEKKDTLTWAMGQWISGMMKACDGKVKAWDVVNEAISGGNADAEGVYALQHADPAGSGNDFFWQDYMGDLDYVRTAVSLAREYGPKDIKLFINDYNLESDWDNNGKLRSLIKWIERWEADGVTKIDGIGTQMHISCSMNANTLKSRREHITKMFEMMRDSKKLVRVSELDMGMDDANGNPVKTGDMTEEMHKAMADHYKFIVSEYLRIIPAAQQWGICQWCITDSPAGSGWRADTPTGLWDLNYNRKHTYAGFADGLSGK